VPPPAIASASCSVGGMAIGTIFTLLILPSLYVLIAKDHSHDRDRAAGSEKMLSPRRPLLPNKFMKISRSLVLCFGSAAAVFAQPAPSQPVPDSLDLPTALRFALDNNFSIRQARERIKQQEGVIVEVKARSIPTVSANGTYQINEKEISSYVPPSEPLVDTQPHSHAGDLRRRRCAFVDQEQ